MKRKIPNVKFIVASYDQFVLNITWMIQDKEASEKILMIYPFLKNKVNLDNSNDEIYQNLYDLLKETYQEQLSMMNKKIKYFEFLWKKNNDQYFLLLLKYLNISWTSNKITIKAYVSPYMPLFPRNIKDYSFCFSWNILEDEVIETIAHECLHFLYFIKWKQLFPNCNEKTFNYPYLEWKLSEMVVDPILNNRKINECLNIGKIKAYDYFYEEKINGENPLEVIREIYNVNQIEEAIIKSYEYLKTVNKTE